MVIYTPIYEFPAPEMDDEPDGVGQLEDLALSIEGAVSTPVVQTWIPEWRSASNPQPSNPGTLTGRYTLFQGWCDFSFWLQMTAASTGGTGQWLFKLPVPGAVDGGEQHFVGKLWEPQVGQFPLQGLIINPPDVLWCFAPRAHNSMQQHSLQQRHVDGAPGPIPMNGPGPLQNGGNIVFNGRYRIA